MVHKQKGSGELPDYVSFLLCLWREKDSASTRWRASLQDTMSNQRMGFASLEELFDYLRRGTSNVPERYDSE